MRFLFNWLRDKKDYAPNKWLVCAAVMVGAFMSVMDVSIVNVALPHMMGSFGQNLSAITWVATAYSIAAVIMVTMAGWWTTLLGRKKFYLISFIIFTVGSILAGTAHTFPEMIIYRILQGIGGGSLIPISQAILRETFPKKEQGMAMAIFSMGVVVAPAIGPVAGGWLTDNLGWPWIFYVNIPFALIGMVMVFLFVHDPEYLKRGVKKIDTVGILLLSFGLTGLQTILERGQEMSWFESPFIFWGTVLTALMLSGMVYWELFVSSEPIVNLRIFKNPQFMMGVCVILLFGIAIYGTTFILPQFTQRLLNYPAFQAGLVLMPRALALICCLPIVGKLYNHVDPRIMMIFGITVVGYSYYDLGHLAVTAGQANIMPVLFIMGTGLPFIFVTLSTLSLSTISRENMTSAAGLFNLFQQVGGNIGYALMATMLDRYTQIHHAFLATHINAWNTSAVAMYHQAAGLLHQHGLSAGQSRTASLALINGAVTKQAEMIAYNDISFMMMFLFIVLVPIVLMIPVPKAAAAEVHVAEM
ncbi:MAG: DHA2 family efflux MFS transporter permease subunit [Candidatus Omnitrophica bacterium]|nr:DHA2 family efflux MFS transporter permease subunit [Candidatus Omnitrophota bacterium]